MGAQDLDLALCPGKAVHRHRLDAASRRQLAQELQVRGERIVRVGEKEGRRAKPRHELAAAAAEGGGIGNAVGVAHAQDVDRAFVQELGLRHVAARLGDLARDVPGPEKVLLAIAVPEPQQVRAVPAQIEGRKVVGDAARALVLAVGVC